MQLEPKMVEDLYLDRSRSMEIPVRPGTMLDALNRQRERSFFFAPDGTVQKNVTASGCTLFQQIDRKKPVVLIVRPGQMIAVRYQLTTGNAFVF